MIIQSNKVFIAGQFMKAQVHIREGKIVEILPCGTKTADADYGDNMLLPGFIDVHTHGAYGYAVDEGTPEGLINWVSKLPLEGVTAVLPTTVTNKDEGTFAALKNIADVMDLAPKGAQILGAHLEGPFLDTEFKGAHDAKLLQGPTVELFKKFQEAARGTIVYMTLATEHDDNFALTRYASQNGVVVAIGHSASTNEEALLALANGATCFVHSFNGMKGLHQREPGVVGTLMGANAFAEIIADGHHVHPNVVNILFKAKNNAKIIMVTDSLMAKGLPPGVHEREGFFKVEVDESGSARLYGTNTLAGSSLMMNKGIQLLVEKALVSIDHAILTATLYPAQVMGIEKQKGQIIAGADADLTVMDDKFNILQTYCLGVKAL
ncbi:MAG: N-acetylglucosamine-6-phosphate deacetylase [Defluviitaleaceae bacterium]|nr:N-acetylglucosamine-6-phosphate deacetylase [Defluviitaleaceae bacterium]